MTSQSAELRELFATTISGKVAACVNAVDRLDAMTRSWSASARVCVLRNFSIDPLAPWLKLAGYQRQMKLIPRFGGYGTYLQELLQPSSPGEKCDALVLALWLEFMPLAWTADGSLNAEAAWDHFRSTVEHALEATRALVVLNTFLPSVGSTEIGSDSDALDGLNARIREWVGREQRLSLVDVARMASRIGFDRAIDARFSFMNRAPASAELLRGWGSRLAQLIAASKGRARKVLVLDADQTLWGGVIGEDGLDGIQLDANEYPGNVFVAFQKQVLALKRRGVLLAICSKNNQADVLKVLDHHSHNLLRREHFSAMRVNWNSKAENLCAIAEELKLGLDSLVFVDDSPVECGLVREALPAVDVLQVPAGSARLSVLSEYDGFDGLPMTPEDQHRGELYRAERHRDEERTQFADVSAFLASLTLEAMVCSPSAEECVRVAQLTQKTNQFNLTTRRYSVGEVQALAKAENSLVVRLSARDRHGDLGLVGVGIATQEGGCSRIDTFLLSCRALGRELETVLLNEIVKCARERWPGCEIVGEYVASEKNGQTHEFYPQRGFRQLDGAPGRALFALSPTCEPTASPPFIRITRR